MTTPLSLRRIGELLGRIRRPARSRLYIPRRRRIIYPDRFRPRSNPRRMPIAPRLPTRNAGHLRLGPGGHLMRHNHLVAGCASGACWVKPKNCLTNVEHPLFVVPCSTFFYVMEIFGVGDCWYVDTDFTQLTSVPSGYTGFPAPTVYFDDCDECRGQTYGGDCTNCIASPDELFNDGDTLIVTANFVGYDSTVDPSCEPGPGASFSEVLFYDAASGEFQGTGFNGHDVGWTLGTAPACANLCRWLGIVDGPGTNVSGTYYAEGGIYAANTDTTNACTGSTQGHNCHPTPPGWDPADYPANISLAAFPTKNRCWSTATADWAGGVPDEWGCCLLI